MSPTRPTRRLSVDGTCVACSESLEAATRVVWHVACAAVLERVDVVVVHVGSDDAIENHAPFLDCHGELNRAASFMARVLQYLETPPCLRRGLVPTHPDLTSVGSLPPETKTGFMPHHKRAHEEAKFRDGVVVDAKENYKKHPPSSDDVATPTKPGRSTFANVGLEQYVRIDRAVRTGMRVTVAESAIDDDIKTWRVVTRGEARDNSNENFWGFDVKVLRGSVRDKTKPEWRVHQGVRYCIE